MLIVSLVRLMKRGKNRQPNKCAGMSVFCFEVLINFRLFFLICLFVCHWIEKRNSQGCALEYLESLSGTKVVFDGPIVCQLGEWENIET